MDGLIGMERQKFPFTIENILSKYPNNNGDRQSCETSGAGLKERAVSPGGVQAETVHRACLCCCYCSHRGDIFQTDFIHEGKTKPICLMCRFTSVYVLNWVLTLVAHWAKTRSPPCSLSVWMAPTGAHRHMQARRCSQRGADTRSGAEENQTSPHYFHRRAAGRTGGTVPAQSVSRCEHKGETSTAHSLKGRKSRGRTAVSHSANNSPVIDLRVRLLHLSTVLSQGRWRNTWLKHGFHPRPRKYIVF